MQTRAITKEKRCQAQLTSNTDRTSNAMLIRVQIVSYSLPSAFCSLAASVCRPGDSLIQRSFAGCLYSQHHTPPHLNMTSDSSADTLTLDFPQRQTKPDFLTALSDDETLIEAYNPSSKEGREKRLGQINRVRELLWERKGIRRNITAINRKYQRAAERRQGKMKTI
jgi:hypothetical protein